MKKLIVLATVLAGMSQLVFAAETTTDGLKNESELGIVVASGNSSSQSFNVKQLDTYLWSGNTFKLEARFLDTSSQAVETARFWNLGLRYERDLSEHIGIFVSELLESNIFSGFLQRYNTDVGGKYSLIKSDDWTWNVEAGYRYTVENRVALQVNSSNLRAYSEATHAFNKTVSAKLWFEYLPNLSQTGDFQFNGEGSFTAALSEVFSTKLAYLLKYRAQPPTGITQNTDTWFTTSLVAKF